MINRWPGAVTSPMPAHASRRLRAAAQLEDKGVVMSRSGQ
jgi:hypothetical protein